MPALATFPRAARTLARRFWHRLAAALRRPAQPASISALFRSLAPGTPLMRDINRLLASDPAQAKQYLVEHFRQRTAPRFFVDTASIREGIVDIQRLHPLWRTRLAQRIEAYRPSASTSGNKSQDHIERDREHLLHFALDLSRALLHGDAEPAWLKEKLDAWLTAIAHSRMPDAYSSPLLAVFRTISLSWSLAFLGARAQQDTIDIEFDLLRILLGDANFIASQLGESFPNNHLLADGFALWYLGTLYPEFTQAAQWRTAGEQVWLRELSRQIYADGTSFEHALHYHNFACEMASAYILLHRRNGLEPAPEILQRFRQMLNFQSALCQFGASPPQPGDSGDATLLALDTAQGGLCLAYGMLNRALFQSATTLGDMNHPAMERAFWLLGARLPDTDDKQPASALAHFPQGGFTFFSDSVRKSQLLFRSGPAPNIELNPGHMHADLLSVYLSVAGEAAIIEAGTYTYRSAPQEPGPHWREYFLSPYAHNGLCLNGLDPLNRGPGSFPGGPIQSRAHCLGPYVSEALIYLNTHLESTTAYAGHCRGLLQVQGEYWLVSDVLPAGSGPASIGWQFQAQAEVVQTDIATLRVKLPHTTLSLAMCGGNGQLALLNGSLDPIGGWVSPHYGELHPAPMARWQVTMDQPCALGTLLVTGAHTPNVECALLAGNALAYRISLGTDTDYVLLARDAACYMEYAGIHFTGRALWLRARNGKPIEVRWLEGTAVEWPEQGLLQRAKQPIPGLHIMRDGITAHPDLTECHWP